MLGILARSGIYSQAHIARAMFGENWRLVTNEPIGLEKKWIWKGVVDGHPIHQGNRLDIDGNSF